MMNFYEKGVQLEKEITLLLKMITFNYIKKGEFSLSYMLSYYVSENYIELLSIGPKFLQ
ncbi:5570_t:CDS:2, partial [Entrophospora sp. SA101]